jgi:hypothetical protein
MKGIYVLAVAAFLTFAFDLPLYEIVVPNNADGSLKFPHEMMYRENLGKIGHHTGHWPQAA